MVIDTGAVELREFNASDGDVLDEVFAGMSEESRYLRYLTPMPTLHDQARRALIAVDGCGHVAVAAFVDGQAIGLARVIGMGGGRAELALEVVDAWQGRGVGTKLGLWIRDRASGTRLHGADRRDVVRKRPGPGTDPQDLPRLRRAA